MKYFAAALFLLAGHLAWADNFSARVAAGQAAAATPDGTAYLNSLWPILLRAANLCNPPGGTAPADAIGQFYLVGNMTHAGRMKDIEVQPANSISTCFALQMGNSQFTPPPPTPLPAYPIVFGLTVKP
jgi:hypothetical protein